MTRKSINYGVVVVVSADPGNTVGLVPEVTARLTKPSNVKLQERGLTIKEARQGDQRSGWELLWQ